MHVVSGNLDMAEASLLTAQQLASSSGAWTRSWTLRRGMGDCSTS